MVQIDQEHGEGEDHQHAGYAHVDQQHVATGSQDTVPGKYVML